ncbi:hypothetical protein [Vibrio sp. 10N.239.312.D08]|uniref:hypothetical protein n=1 Tax=Vibrio sp. 10N.239.312.D08 TaxID=3229978 RepID=UPI0035520167
MTFDYDAFMRKQEELRIEAEHQQRKKEQDRLKRIESIETPEGTVVTIDGYPMTLRRGSRIGVEDIDRLESVLTKATGIKGILFSLISSKYEYNYYHPDSVLLFNEEVHSSERNLPFQYEPEQIIGLWNGQCVNDLLLILVNHLRTIKTEQVVNFESLLYTSIIPLQSRRFDEKTHKNIRVGLVESRRFQFFIDRQGRGLFITPEDVYHRDIKHAALDKGAALITNNREEAETLLVIFHACNYGTRYSLNNENGWVNEFLNKIRVINSLDMAVSMMENEDI